MVDARFVSLREMLLKAGVAAPHARRACLEIQCHYEQMIDAATTLTRPDGRLADMLQQFREADSCDFRAGAAE